MEERIGTYRIEKDCKRLRAAQCPKYDEWVDIVAGDYPVYARQMNNDMVTMAVIDFECGFGETWYGFMLAQDEKFTPDNGWGVRHYTFKSVDGREIPTGYIYKI